MRLSAWLPDYELKKLTLSKDKTKINSTMDDVEMAVKPEEISISVIGYVEKHKKEYAIIQDQISATVHVLDSLDELGIESQVFVGYKGKNGNKFLGEISEFEGEIYQTNCENPTIDTKIISGLKDKKIIFVAGIPSEKEVMQYVTSLCQYKKSGKLNCLETIAVIDQCTNSVGENRDELDYFAKYTMEQAGAKIVEMYRGDTKIA